MASCSRTAINSRPQLQGEATRRIQSRVERYIDPVGCTVELQRLTSSKTAGKRRRDSRCSGDCTISAADFVNRWARYCVETIVSHRVVGANFRSVV